MLSEEIDKLPPGLKKEAMDYIEFLKHKYQSPHEKPEMRFSWAGCLSHLKNKFTSVELQHKASEWR